MSEIFLLFLCLAVGMALRKWRAMPADGAKVLNQYVIFVALPALTLYFIPKITLSAALLYPVMVSWIGLAGAFLLFAVLGRLFQWPKALIGALTLTTGLGNTSFVGIPVIRALYGSEAIDTVLLVDQPGSFVALVTAGMFIAGYYSGSKDGSRAIFTRILRFPPFVAFLLALLLGVFGLRIPEFADNAFLAVGNTLVPVALVSVGLQLTKLKRGEYGKYVALGLGYKLILHPLIILILYVFVLGQSGMDIEVSIMEAAMGPMVTANIIASNAGLKPRLCNIILSLGIPLSFLTLALWYTVLQWI